MNECFEVLRAMKGMSSIDTPITESGGTLQEVIANDDQSADEAAVQVQRDEYVQRIVSSVRRDFNAREQIILDETHPAARRSRAKDAAGACRSLLQSTRERIRQIQNKILEKLKKAFERKLVAGQMKYLVLEFRYVREPSIVLVIDTEQDAISAVERLAALQAQPAKGFWDRLNKWGDKVYFSYIPIGG